MSIVDTSRRWLDSLSGRVLMVGLGDGLLVEPILSQPSVTALHVIDNDPEAIAGYVGGDGWTSALADWWEWSPADGDRYDHVLIDIWETPPSMTDIKAAIERCLSLGLPLPDTWWQLRWREQLTPEALNCPHREHMHAVPSRCAIVARLSGLPILQTPEVQPDGCAVCAATCMTDDERIAGAVVRTYTRKANRAVALVKPQQVPVQGSLTVGSGCQYQQVVAGGYRCKLIGRLGGDELRDLVVSPAACHACQLAGRAKATAPGNVVMDLIAVGRRERGLPAVPTREEAKVIKTPSRPQPCIHLGKRLRHGKKKNADGELQMVGCESCKVYHCDLLQSEITRGPNREGLHRCDRCKDYVADSAEQEAG